MKGIFSRNQFFYIYIFYNFSDDVLNPNGERFGSSDIYYASKFSNFVFYTNINKVLFFIFELVQSYIFSCNIF